MELTPVKTEEEAASEGKKLGHAGSYLFLGAVAVASWFVLPVLAGIVTAAPVVAAVAGIGGAAAVTAHKPWREKAVSFFKKAGSFFSEALGTVVSDYRGARDWAKGRAAEAAAEAAPAPANDDASPSSLGAKASAADFKAAAEAASATVKAPSPAPSVGKAYTR